ncbi:MAG: LysM peptidoglycan-binding domain-containing protein [Candidatus Marinimicrobia bacterium]|nr:LysM peptidoglycan-binding domain-containing protein [Candidatus Neomarinimicrobiota bacterium]
MKNLFKILLVLVVIGLIAGCGKKEKSVKKIPEAKIEQKAKPVVTEKEKAVSTTEQEAKPVVTEKEEVLPDTITITYMTQPNDCLIKIAKAEYSDATMWRSIWKWNYEAIGENPDLIYPYKELILKKPRVGTKNIEYELVDYTVKQGESLWSIAKTEYGNNFAWIVILKDNYDTIGDHQNLIKPGTILKLRTKLIN